MSGKTIEWIRAAQKAFESFPADVQIELRQALQVVALGGKPDNAKPMHGLGSGVFEIAVRHHTGAWRVVYAIRIGNSIWMIHAFQKKSKTGSETPQAEIETIRRRLTRIRTMTR